MPEPDKLCACGKPRQHLTAPEDSRDWGCRVPDFDRTTGQIHLRAKSTEVCNDWCGPGSHHMPPCPAAPTAPPAEVQQDDEREAVARWLASRDMNGSQHSWHEDADVLLQMLAARPSAATEALRRVRELADELDRQARDMELVRVEAVAAKPADPATAYADSVARNVGKEWTKIAARIRSALDRATGDTMPNEAVDELDWTAGCSCGWRGMSDDVEDHPCGFGYDGRG